MSREGFAYVDVAAGVGVRAWGLDVAGCFRQCALAVFGLVVPVGCVLPAEPREVAARGEATQTLLASWIDECLYLHEMEAFVLHDLDAPRIEDGRVHAILHGEILDPRRHRRGATVKAAGVQAVRVDGREGPAEAWLVLEV